MKTKLLLLLVAVLVMTGAGHRLAAQNANRNGFIIELQGGGALGTIETDRLEYVADKNAIATAKKGGFVGQLNIGYRWATSINWAVELRAGISDNFSESSLYIASLMPGVRYTSRELFGNKSLYASFNAGVGYNPYGEAIFVPLDLNVGLNLTNSLYAGVFFDYNICASSSYYKYYDLSNYRFDDGNYPINQRYGDSYLSSHAVIGIKLGIRL